MSEFPFPSYGYYDALRERLEDCTYKELRDRLAQAQRYWTAPHGMVEQYAHQLYQQQAITVQKIKEAVDMFERLTYRDIRRLVTNLERTQTTHG